MVSKKRGAVLEYEDMFVEYTSNHHAPKIQKAKMECGCESIHIIKPIASNERRWGFTLYVPSYKGIRTIIQGLVEINGKEEVERELGIEIKEEMEK